MVEYIAAMTHSQLQTTALGSLLSWGLANTATRHKYKTHPNVGQNN
jgi:hypothetical protein